MKLYPDKCLLILSGKENRRTNFGKVVIKNLQAEKLLGVFFEEKATYGYNTENLCIKASRKLQALERVARYMYLSKRKILMKLLKNPLVWMCRNHALTLK